MSGFSVKRMINPYGIGESMKPRDRMQQILDPFGITGKTKTEKSRIESKENEEAAALEKKTSDIEKAAREADAVAEQKARDEARDKLRRQTQTVFSSGFNRGMLGTKDGAKTTLGQ